MIDAGGVALAQSICFGSTANGRLEGGVRLPGEGKNYLSYGSLPELLGRTYVHSTVRDVVVAAYALLESDQPGKVYKYAETGFADGGPFRPHKTHQNGLSADFIVPVIDAQGRSVPLPTNPLNKWGYDVEFDSEGRFERYRIDFEALGAHLVALHEAAKQHGIEIWRVIFAPDLQPSLYETRYGAYLKAHILIPSKRSWVRHDDHYHVDFKVPCRPM